MRLVARVGADASAVLDALASEGVDVGAVRSNGLAATGIATVVVDDAGENTIVVDPGAGADLSVQGRGTALPAAVERAVLAASHDATGVGAQTAMPYAAQLDPPAVISAFLNP
ncbi:PfkB family carbohydrate kinase [Streptomyces sp. NPDC057565]|uniref:PfkB family carbohydrate kinase n=1 Tax=Streptomyces sp. NPDC057565 TaxID=3346169 RepID=UPI0036C58680